MYFDVFPGRMQREKIALCEAQNWRCCYCKFTVRLVFGYTDDQDAATREHLKPEAKGGTDDFENLVIACNLCNRVRDHANPYRFELSVMKLLENEAIRKAWHRFTASQVGLLRQEIEFAAIVAKVTTRSNPGSLNVYAHKLEQRRRFIERIRAN